MPALLNILLAVTLWVQVPQWNDDWSNCAVDVPDTSCHWYIVQADNTFGEGFDWETAPWYSVEGLQDVANLHDQTLESGHGDSQRLVVLQHYTMVQFPNQILHQKYYLPGQYTSDKMYQEHLQHSCSSHHSIAE